MSIISPVRVISLKYIIKWLETKDKTDWVKNKLSESRKEYELIKKIADPEIFELVGS